MKTAEETVTAEEVSAVSGMGRNLKWLYLSKITLRSDVPGDGVTETETVAMGRSVKFLNVDFEIIGSDLISLSILCAMTNHYKMFAKLANRNKHMQCIGQLGLTLYTN